MGACALMTLAAVSCGKCGDSSCDAAATDSLSTAYGTYVGSMIQQDFTRMEGQTESTKEEFLRGMQIAFTNESKNTRMGIQVGLQMMAEMEQLKEQGISVDKTTILNAFKQVFLSDSLSYTQIQDNAAEFQRLYTDARTKATEARNAEKAAAPEAVENGKKADEYIAGQKAANPEIKTTESGLSYLIGAEGEGAHPAETATVVVNYTGKHINGEVFDTTDGRGPATFNLQGVVPGFREGLMLLGKGGKATLYMPGNLAYGPEGQPAAGIGPNEMLIFDVELVDITE